MNYTVYPYNKSTVARKRLNLLIIATNVFLVLLHVKASNMNTAKNRKKSSLKLSHHLFNHHKTYKYVPFAIT